jgi:hypothetical protein
MGAGFIRRFGYQPDAAVLSQIEGVAIIDLPQPTSLAGVGTGTVAVVGEFADCTYACSVNATTGAVSTNYRPVEIVSSTDLLAKVGGFDSTLGQFGGAFGNGYALLAGKAFARLIVVPVNLASSKGMRVFRSLPLHASASSTSLASPLSPAGIPAGFKFKESSNVVKTASAVQFTALPAKVAALTGQTYAEASVTVFTFSATGVNFTTSGVVEGDVIVIGASTSSNKGTFRVKAVSSATALDIEKMDGSSGTNTAESNLPFSIYPGTNADSNGEHQASEAAGYTVLARPIDASITASANLAVVTPVESISDLAAKASPDGITYTAALQGDNAANSSTMNDAYEAALDVLLADALPQNQTNIVICARTSAGIAAALKNHVESASAQGLGRMAIVSPGLGMQTVDGAISSAAASSETATSFGVASSGAAGRKERIIYSWPGVKQLLSEADGIQIAGADGTTVVDGEIDMPFYGHYASLLSQLAPERNPGELSPVTEGALASAIGFQRGAPALKMNDYITLKQYGVSALRFDVSDGAVIQSGITSSITTGEKTVNRRRMADYIQDSLAAIYNKYAKQPLSTGLKNTILGETDAFLSSLLSASNPQAQRIAEYVVDGKSGNTPALEAQGIYVVVIRVRTLASADVIVLNSQIGESVQVTAA